MIFITSGNIEDVFQYYCLTSQLSLSNINSCEVKQQYRRTSPIFPKEINIVHIIVLNLFGDAQIWMNVQFQWLF